MTFRSGSISYARYRVVGDAPRSVEQSLIDALEAHVIQPASIGAPPEVQAGFCAGQHVFDETFDAETVAFGGRLLFGMRIDTNKVPSEIRRAYRSMAERNHAQQSPTGFINRAEKQAARDDAEDRCRRELAEGRFRSSKLVPVLWDLERKIVLAPAFSDARQSALNDLFLSAFDCRLEAMTAGALSRELLEARGLHRDYEDAKPSAFTKPPAAGDDGRELSEPVVSWSHAGPEPSDFLGNEFLLWLWRLCDVEGGLIDTTDNGADPRTVNVAIDRVLDMECAWDVTGKASLRADGPARLPEARRALLTGKWPRKAGLLIAMDDEHWQVTVQGDRLLVTGLKIPKPEDAAAQTPRDEVERRLESLGDFEDVMLRLFDAFLQQRFSDHWPTQRQQIGDWIRNGVRQGSTTSTPTAQPRTQPTVEIETMPAREPAAV